MCIVRRLLTWMCAVLLLHAVVDAQTETVRWADQRLTVRAMNAPLRTLFEDVARRTGIVVTGADRLLGYRSVDIRDESLGGALHVLLKNVNFVVTLERGLFHLHIHSMSGSAPAEDAPILIPGLTDRVVTRADRVVEAPGQRDPLDDEDQDEQEEQDREEKEELTTLEQVADSKTPNRFVDFTNALQSDYAEVRIRALHLLAARSDPAVIDDIVSAFEDEQPNVMLTASDILASMPAEVALEALARQLSPEISFDAQFAALRSLALRADVSSIPAVGRAAREGHPKVREFAERLLQALEERERNAAKPKG